MCCVALSGIYSVFLGLCSVVGVVLANCIVGFLGGKGGISKRESILTLNGERGRGRRGELAFCLVGCGEIDRSRRINQLPPKAIDHAH